MTTFQVSPSGLQQAALVLQPASGSLSGTSIPVPNPAMYGQLVGSAAADCEPSTTTASNDLIQALSELYGAISDQLNETGRCYTQNEDDLVRLVRAAIEGMLR